MPVSAQNRLGVCYEYGTGVEKDEQKAIELYQKASKQEHAKVYVIPNSSENKHTFLL